MMPTFDVYGVTDTLPEPILEVIAMRLEARGQHAAFQRRYLAAGPMAKLSPERDTGTVAELNTGD
jgi:hypothetical protein